MLNVSIPHESFDDINSDVLLMINQERKLIRVGLNQHSSK
jgi:D-glycerate 3-kinase